MSDVEDYDDVGVETDDEDDVEEKVQRHIRTETKEEEEEQEVEDEITENTIAALDEDADVEPAPVPHKPTRASAVECDEDCEEACEEPKPRRSRKSKKGRVPFGVAGTSSLSDEEQVALANQLLGIKV